MANASIISAANTVAKLLSRWPSTVSQRITRFVGSADGCAGVTPTSWTHMLRTNLPDRKFYYHIELFEKIDSRSYPKITLSNP